MKQDLQIEVAQESINLLTNVVYRNAPFWYGETERPLRLSMYVPKHREGHERMPVLLWLCGGAFQVMDKDVWMPELLDIARRGYIVASAEYRTCDNAPFPAAVVDVKAAIRFLKAHAAQYCIDPDRFYVAGESAGGTIACQVGLLHDPAYEVGNDLQESSCVNGVIDFYGPEVQEVYDPAAEMPRFYAAAIEEYGGYPEDTGDLRRAASPVLHVTADAPPFLIFHGVNDEKVDIASSERLYAALQEAGVPSDFYRIVGASHGADEFYQKRIMDLVVAFMEQ